MPAVRHTLAVVLCICSLGPAVSAGAEPDFTPNLRNAPGLATATTRHDVPVLLFFTAPWCTACKAVKRHVLTGDEVDQVLAHFQTVEIDIEHGPAEATLAQTWGVDALPTLIALLPDGQTARYDGRLERRPLLKWLRALIAQTDDRQRGT